jgi:hypothetical protein
MHVAVIEAAWPLVGGQLNLTTQLDGHQLLPTSFAHQA